MILKTIMHNKTLWFFTSVIPDTDPGSRKTKRRKMDSGSGAGMTYKKGLK